ncbi:hypothetical protein CHELA20_50188 [Hyphomicrobiales bacterium]|nr:hypothetical protein CHELA41_20183 [Hyphomicrobiales bacterium]CAH1667302.1 hypothetical protein CHELA20_50188 [Hyphomicrobiales bacterium]
MGLSGKAAVGDGAPRSCVGILIDQSIRAFHTALPDLASSTGFSEAGLKASQILPDVNIFKLANISGKL